MTRRRLGDTLISWGVITPQQLEAALEAQGRDGRTVRRRLGRVLIDAGFVNDGAVAAALADMHGLQVVDLDLQIIDPSVARRIPEVVAAQRVVLPLTVRDGVLRVAVADPVDVVALDDLRMRAHGMRLEVVVAPEGQLREKITGLFSQAMTEDALEKFAADLPDEIEIGSLDSNEDAGAVAAVHQILIAAVRAGASDCHIEPMRDGVRVRVRVDGTLRPLMTLPRSRALLDRGPHEDRLRTRHRRAAGAPGRSLPAAPRGPRPQPARLHPAHPARREGRGAAAGRADALPSLSDLGLGLDQELILQNALHMPQGLVLITGPPAPASPPRCTPASARWSTTSAT